MKTESREEGRKKGGKTKREGVYFWKIFFRNAQIKKKKIRKNKIDFLIKNKKQKKIKEQRRLKLEATLTPHLKIGFDILHRITLQRKLLQKKTKLRLMLFSYSSQLMQQQKQRSY